MAQGDPNAIGFAVVGLGMGKHHVRSIEAAKGAKLVAVCDVQPDLAKSIADQYGVEAYTDYRELLKNPDVQVVNVATPTGLHAQVGIDAAKAGKHVICEKPLDVTVDKAQALIDACRQNNVKLASIFQRRVHPLSRKLKQAVEEGRLGHIYYADIHLYWYRKPEYYAGGYPRGWRGTFAMDGGGAAMNQGIHSIDFLQWIVGPVASLFAKTGTYGHDIEAEDVGTAIVTFRNGAIGNITCTTCAYPGLTNDFHLICEKGTVVLTNDSVVTWRIQGPNEEEEEAEMQRMYSGGKDNPSADPMAVGFDGHTIQIEDMVQAIRESRNPIISGESAIHAVEIANAIQESARTGQEVTVGLPAPKR